MAVTNLLDRLAEEYEGNHPVEYRAPLAKLGKTIGKKVYSLGGGSKGVSARDIIRINRNDFDKGIYPYDLLENQPDKIDLDEFNKAFENVRAQREAWNTKYFKDDALGYNGDPLATPKENLLNKKTYLSYEADKQNPRQTPMDLYGVFDWKDWKNAKDAAKQQGQKLGRMYAEQNQLEKNMYGNISKGLMPTTDKVPEGRYKYALGNQNHVYSDSPDDPEGSTMPLEPNYPGESALTNSGHPIHYRNGKPFIDAYTWTQKNNIDNIKKTGYLAIEGNDTKGWHPGTKGQWTAEVDNFPMRFNYDNNVEIFKRGKNGETFNEDLIHSKIPLNWYQNAPVIHQGPRAYGVKVDVIQAKPGAPEVMIGEGATRRLEKVATPNQFLHHIPEDKIRKDWAPVWNIEMLPGSHPNKEDLGNTKGFIMDVDGKYPFGSTINQRKKLALQLANQDDKALSYALSKIDEKDDTQLHKEAQKAFVEDYINRSSGKRTPHDLVKNTKNPPKQGKGAYERGDVSNGGGWFESTDDSDFKRTKDFLMQRDVDYMPIRYLGQGKTRWLDFPNIDSRTNFDPFFKGNLTPGSLNNLVVQGNYSHVVPKDSDYGKFIEQYLDNIGLENLKELDYKKARLSTNNPFNHDKDFTVHSKAKANLDVLLDEKREMARNKVTGGRYDALSGMLFNLPDDKSKIKNFDKWYEKQSAPYVFAPTKENAKKAVDDYYAEFSRLPSNKELAKRAVENASIKYYGNPKNNELRKEINKDLNKEFMQADSLDKVIGHTIGRRIGADRAKRGKKIF